MHSVEIRHYCSRCNALGWKRRKERLGKGKFVRLCGVCWEGTTLAYLAEMEPDRRPSVHVDVWQCDICKKRAEKDYPDEWRNIFMAGPTEESEPVEIDLCEECLATKALTDVPWPKRESENDEEGSGESSDGDSEVCVQR